MNGHSEHQRLSGIEQSRYYGHSQNEDRLMYAAPAGPRVEGNWTIYRNGQCSERINDQLPPRHNGTSSVAAVAHSQRRWPIDQKSQFPEIIQGEIGHKETSSVMNLSQSSSDSSIESSQNSDLGSFDQTEYTLSEEAEWEPMSNINCMNSLLFPTQKDQDNSNEMGVIRCNRVGPSGAELRLNFQMPSEYMDRFVPLENNVEEYMDNLVPSESRLDGAMDSWRCKGANPIDKKCNFDYGSHYTSVDEEVVERDPYRQFRERIAPQCYESLLNQLSEGSVDEDDDSTINHEEYGLFNTETKTSGNPIMLDASFLPSVREASLLQSSPSQIFIQEVPTNIDELEGRSETIQSIELTIACSSLEEEQSLVPDPTTNSSRCPTMAVGAKNPRGQEPDFFPHFSRNSNYVIHESKPFKAVLGLQSAVDKREASNRVDGFSSTAHIHLNATQQDSDCSSVLAVHPDNFIDTDDESDDVQDEHEQRAPSSGKRNGHQTSARCTSIKSEDDCKRESPRRRNMETVRNKVPTKPIYSPLEKTEASFLPDQAKPSVHEVEELSFQASNTNTQVLGDDKKVQFIEEMYPSFDEPGQIHSRANKQPGAETTAAPIKGKRSAVAEEGQFTRIMPHREVPSAVADYFVQNRSAHQIARKLTNLQSTARSSDSGVESVQNEANETIDDELTKASPKVKALVDDSGIENNKNVGERSRDARDGSVDYSSEHSSCPPALIAKIGIEGDELMGTQPTYSNFFRRDAYGNIVLDEGKLKVNEQKVELSQTNSDSEKVHKNNISGLQKLAAVAVIANMIGTLSRDKKVRMPQTEKSPDSDGDEDVPELEELYNLSNDENSAVDAGKGISALLLYRWL
jgi:hypothetical protein